MVTTEATARIGGGTLDILRGLGDQFASGLERLMASPSPLDRIAPPPSYSVERGDTLSSIASRFGTTVETLTRINGISDPDRIRVGQDLRLPAGSDRGSHVVQAGETLDGIARAAGTDWHKLARINGLADPGMIRPGQTLILHEGAVPTTAAPPRPAAEPSTVQPTPQASGAHRLGSLSERYESGGRGPGTVSSGAADDGGVSYGVYQLSSAKGTAAAFMRTEGSRWAGELTGTPGSASFSEAWKAIAAREPQAFREAQHAFIERTHYEPVVDKVKDATGLDLDMRHDAVRDAVWSASVQHGRAATLLTEAVTKTDATHQRGSAGYDRALVENIYAGRTSYLRDLASSGRYTSAEAQSLRDIASTRYPAELRDARALLDRSPAPEAQAAAAPSPRTQANSATRFAEIIQTSGDAAARADLAAGRKVLVAVRSDSALGANGNRGEYNDQMALVWRDGSGTYQARTFAGNTEPAGVYAARGYGVDVNGDGRKELGRLVEGSYRYERQQGTFAGNSYFRATQTQAALRDSNHDRRFTAADRTDATGAGRSLLIHQGGTNSTGSAGCQTLRPNDFNALLGALGDQNRFSYVLVNAGK